ncbi:SulP family inorganic anion transporter [bacterium]|nr:SulP family inorganic anion transporter [bacterium]
MIKGDILYKLFPFLAWKPLITLKTLQSDLIAGLTGAVIVLPQGVAFAMIAGLPPQYGLYTAMVTPVIAALFGSSRHLISGPTTAISIVIFSTISSYVEPGTPEFIQMALMLTFFAGIYQLGFGLARLGALVNFVSPTVITGFTAGASILIITSQLKYVLGMQIPRGESFLSTWFNILRNIDSFNPTVFMIAAVTLLAAVGFKIILKRGPVLLIAMIIGSLLNLFIQGEQHGVVVIGKLDVFLPMFSPHHFTLSSIRHIAPKALAVSLLGLIEAVSISSSVASRSHQQVDVNQEFIGQGLSNIVGSFFSSYAGSGSFTRTGVNFDAGAKTQLAAIFSALFLLIILIFASSLTAYLPVASMGGIILLVAYNLVEFDHIRLIFRVSLTESLIFAITFFSTLFLNLEFAIYVGVILSLFFYLNQSARPKIVALAPDPEHPKRRLISLEKVTHTECPQLKIVQINGSIFFGAVHHVESTLSRLREEGFRYKYILLVADGINIIDIAGAEMLAQQSEQILIEGGGLFFVALKADAQKILEKEAFKNLVNSDQVYESISSAIAAIVPQMDKEKCQLCFRNVFFECREMREEQL